MARSSQNRTRCVITHRVRLALTNPFLLAICILSLVGGCEHDGIEIHEVAKGVEEVPAAEGAGKKSDEDAEPEVRGDRPWAVPDGWTEDPKPRQMRLATYIVPDSSGPVEVAVSRFAGRVGGELANINRWRGQMGLPAIDEAELEETIARFSAPGFDGYKTRIEALPSGVMLAAGVYEEAIDQMWFVRATVPDAAVADRLQADLFSMARSIAGLGDEGDD